MAVASQLAIGMSLPLPPELQSINCQLFNDAACSSQWPHELRKAWRQYCDEFGEVDRDPHQFANAALMIAKSNPKGAAAVFRSGHAALRCITTPPGVKQVAYFYDKIVDTTKYPLGMLIKRAASEHLEGRSLDFVLLAGSYVFFFCRDACKHFSSGCARKPRDGNVCAHISSRTSQECSMLLRGHILATLGWCAAWWRLLGCMFSFGSSAWSIRACHDPFARRVN